MKSFIIFSSLFLFVLFVSCNKNEEFSIVKKKVSMIFPVTIDSFDQLEQGFTSVCSDTFDVRFFSAEGDPAKFETVIQSALLTKPDYLITIGTQITNTAFGPKFKNSLPVVIAGAISSPELVDGLKSVGIQPKRNFPVAIISDNPKESIFELFSKAIREFLPGIEKVGIIYNTSEINSKETANNIKSTLMRTGVTVIDGIINNLEDVEKITNNLIIKGAKLVIIPHDKYAVTKAASIVKLSMLKNIPVFSLDDGTVRKGGVSVGVSVNYRTVGEIIGSTLLNINSNEVKAEELPVIVIERAGIYINANSLDKLNIKIPHVLIGLIEK